MSASSPVDSALKLSSVVTLKGTDSPHHALKVFSEKHITSAPILNSSGNFVGVIEINDIVSWIIHYIYKKYSVDQEDQKGRIEQISKIQVKSHDLDGFVHKFEHFPIEQIIRSEASSCVIRPDTSVLAALGLFVSTETPAPIQRLVVMDEHQKIVNFISKSAVLKFFKTHPSLFSSIAESPLSSLEGSIIHVTAVCQRPSSTSLLTAFALLDEYRLNTLALLDENDEKHQPLTVLSMSDIKALHTNPRRLADTVSEFARAVRMDGSVSASLPFISITPQTTLASTIEKLCSVHLHQIYVASAETGAIIGICTLDSILQVLKKHLGSS